MGIHNSPINPPYLRGMCFCGRKKLESAVVSSKCYLNLPCLVVWPFTESRIAPELPLTRSSTKHGQPPPQRPWCPLSRPDKSTTSQNQVSVFYFKCTKSPGTSSLVRVIQIQSNKFFCMFFFSFFGFQSGLGLMPSICTLSKGRQGWVSWRKGASFPGPAPLCTH